MNGLIIDRKKKTNKNDAVMVGEKGLVMFSDSSGSKYNELIIMPVFIRIAFNPPEVRMLECMFIGPRA